MVERDLWAACSHRLQNQGLGNARLETAHTSHAPGSVPSLGSIVRDAGRAGTGGEQRDGVLSRVVTDATEKIRRLQWSPLV